MVNKWGFVSVFVLVCLMAFTASANVVLTIGNNVTLSFDDVEANFAPSVKSSGNCGILYVAEPLDACLPLTNIVDPTEDINKSPFVLIIRGGCSFEEKARKAQVAGFKAVIVYDNEYGDLVAMAGNAVGIKIPAIFISKDSGQTLIKYANNNNTEVWLIPSFENSAWSIMAISFISLLAMSAVLATCFFVRRHQIRRDLPRNSRVRSFHGMSSRLVNALPSLVFTSALEDNVNSTSLTCSICLDDYTHGDKIRLLPCRHKFHVTCVDAWLTKQRTFCPVCKRDARTLNGEPPASESTPLLSSTSSSVSSSFRSSVSSSSAIQILSPINTPYNQHYLLQSYHQSPHLSINRNGSSQRSLGSYMLSSHSLNFPSMSPFNTRFVQSPADSSSSYVGSSNRLTNALHYSESVASFSPLTSAHSLPECETVIEIDRD